MRWTAAILLALLSFLQYSLWAGHGGLLDVWRLETAVARQTAENDELRERNAALEAEVVDLKGGLEAVEERARSGLGMIKDGEIFYQVVDE